MNGKEMMGFAWGAWVALTPAMAADRGETLIRLTHQNAAVRGEAALTLGDDRDPEAVAWLMIALGDPEEGVRKNAATALMNSGGPAALSLFVEAMGHVDPLRRRGAIQALSRMGPLAASKDLMMPFAQALNDPDRAVRIETLRALSHLHPSFGSKLRAFGQFLNDPDPEIRRTALDVVARMGSGARWALPQVQALMKDPDPVWRIAALSTVNDLVGAEGFMTYYGALLDSVVSVRLECLRLLGFYSEDVSFGSVAHLTKLLSEGDSRLRLGAVKVLKSPAAHQGAVLMTLLGCLRDSDAAVRFEVVDFIGGVIAKGQGDSIVFVSRLAGLVDDPAPEVRMAVLDALAGTGHTGGRRAVEAVERATEDADPKVREKAAQVLGHAGLPCAFPGLARAVLDPDTVVKTAARIAQRQLQGHLAYFGFPGTEEWLEQPGGLDTLARYLKDAVPFRREEAAASLRRAKERSMPFWLIALKDPAADAREIAVESLGLMKLPGTQKYVFPLLNDPAPRVRAAAVWALTAFAKDPKVKPTIQAMLKDGDSRVQAYAALALRVKQP